VNNIMYIIHVEMDSQKRSNTINKIVNNTINKLKLGRKQLTLRDNNFASTIVSPVKSCLSNACEIKILREIN